MATREQIQANRQNGRKGKGPKTAKGKAKSSQNAITHGLTATPEVLEAAESPAPGDPSPAYQEALAEWVDDLKPRGMLERTLTERACRAAWRLKRCDRFEDAAAAIRDRDAADAFDLEQGRRAREIGLRLIKGPAAVAAAKAGGDPDGDDPEGMVAELQRSVAGVDWLIAQWDEWGRALDRPGGWGKSHKADAIRMLGVRADETDRHPLARLIAPSPGAPEPQRGQVLNDPVMLALYYQLLETEKTHPAPESLWEDYRQTAAAWQRRPNGPGVDPATLREVVRAERERLMLRKSSLLESRALSDRAGAADRSLFEDARSVSLCLRYTTSASRDLHRAIMDLLKLRKDRAADGDGAGPDAPPIPDSPSSPPVDPVAPDGPEDSLPPDPDVLRNEPNSAQVASSQLLMDHPPAGDPPAASRRDAPETAGARGPLTRPVDRPTSPAKGEVDA
jgi:hypothetical protein